MALIAIDPFQDFARLNRQLIEAMGRDYPASAGATWNPTCTVTESDADIKLTVELPGVEEKDLSVQQLGSQVTITAKRQFDTVTKDGRGSHRESFSGRFERTFVLPDHADQEKVEATYAKGLLQIRIPKRSQAKPKAIPISAA